MHSYLWKFWSGMWLTAAILVTGLHLWWQPRLNHLPPPPPFYFSKDLFLGFDEPGESVPHDLWRFGLFGFGERLRDADFVMVGTSHFWFGISASLISERLSAAAGHPVRVVNMGLGGADVAFQAQILKERHVRDKQLVIDVFAPHGEGYSPWGADTARFDWVQGYVHVLKVWANGVREWCLDPWVPNVKIYGGHIIILRIIEGVFVCRWDTGDTEYMWNPGLGYVFRRGVPPPSDMNIPFEATTGTSERPLDQRIYLPKALQDVIKSNNLKPILTLIPYLGYQPEVAERIALLHGYPFVSVAPDGLTFRDPEHLNAAARDIASARLAAGIQQQRDASPPASVNH